MGIDNPGRRQRLLDQSAAPGSRINAIDYVVVLDGDDVLDSLRQRILLVRFFFTDHVEQLGGEHVTIEGGVRVRDPRVAWAARMSDLLAPGSPALDAATGAALSTDEQAAAAAILAAELEPDAWLVVRVREYGDFSHYTLRVTEPEGTSPAGSLFDPKLCEVRFSFKADCPSEFDCREAGPPPAPGEPAPPIDYLARDFASFRRLMFERLALTQPDDRSTDPATLRATLVEALAWAADEVSYHLDAVATETYLGTARLRRSVRRHARLLDYAMHEGVNARAFVQLAIDGALDLSRDPSLDAPLLRRGARLLTRVAHEGVTLEPAEEAEAYEAGAHAFELMHDVWRLSGAHGEIALHTWADDEHTLPAGATRATLRDPDSRVALEPGDLLVLEASADAVTGRAADADPERRHVVRLTRVSRATDLLAESGGLPVVEVEWADEDALPFDLPVRAGGVALAVARGDVVLVDHGRSRVEPSLQLEPYGNQGRAQARLGRERPDPTGLSWSEPLEEGAPAARLLRQDPRRARPAVSLRERDGTSWTPRRDLLSSAPSARDFVVEMESDGVAWLRFGDDVLGRRPAAGAVFEARYRAGNGTAGNVGAEAIGCLVTDLALVDASVGAALRSVRNPLPASGGLPAETVDEVKLYAPYAYRVQERAVTIPDWEAIASRHPKVQRALAAIRWTGTWQTVFLHVDPVGGGELDEALELELLAYLERYRLSGYDLELVGARYVPLDIAFSVCVETSARADDVERRLRAELGSGHLPDGRLGFFHPDRFTFGQSVYLSQLVARATAVDGVRWIDLGGAPIAGAPTPRFKRRGAPQGPELERGVLDIDRFEIARLDGDPSMPEHGRIELWMEGGR